MSKASGVLGLGVVAGVLVLAGASCGGPIEPPPPPPPTVDQPDGGPDGGLDAGADAGSDAGTDAGPDGGTDGGLDGGSEPSAAEAWPQEPVVNYSARFGIGSVQSVGIDDGYNLWLLHQDLIGVLRPGDTQPTWTQGVGKAAGGFGEAQLALGSTVICGGSEGRAYVGYWTYSLRPAFIFDQSGTSFPRYDDPDPSRYDPERYEEYQKGDLDIVRLAGDGTVVLEEPLQRTLNLDGTPRGPQDIGIRNTNDFHFDEDRSVLSCTKVMRGQHRGQVYIGTNHGVTRIEGLTYNSHRHPVWFNSTGTQMTGYTYALGVAQGGDVLIGNEWKVEIVTPSEHLAQWDAMDDSLNERLLSSHLDAVNSLEEKDYWRGFQQTVDGTYYLGSKEYGLWRILEIRGRSTEFSEKVRGLPTDQVTALAATDDGSLFIGTEDAGLWRMLPDGSVSRFQDVSATRVRQLVYDPTPQSSMLLVLTDAGLFVLRGH